MAFEMASTNMVAGLGIILTILIGWQFTAAEFMGAPIMVFTLVFLFRRFLSRKLVNEAKQQADRGIAGVMEGHAEMDMAVTEGPIFAASCQTRGEPPSGGLLIAGAHAAWVPRGL